MLQLPEREVQEEDWCVTHLQWLPLPTRRITLTERNTKTSTRMERPMMTLMLLAVGMCMTTAMDQDQAESRPMTMDMGMEDMLKVGAMASAASHLQWARCPHH